ncbi:MAG TPA: hypothetical protein ENI42_05840, partial [Thermoplasmatales archaeon]|nr:hypothetical protein [Thermoplasmatales archaeon]
MQKKKGFTKTVSSFLVFFILNITILQSSHAIENIFDNQRKTYTVIIRVALYDAHDKYNIQQFKEAFNYKWRKGSKIYRFNVTTI